MGALHPYCQLKTLTSTLKKLDLYACIQAYLLNISMYLIGHTSVTCMTPATTITNEIIIHRPSVQKLIPFLPNYLSLHFVAEASY